MILDDPHMAFDGQAGPSRNANGDMAGIHVDFDTLFPTESLGSFEPCIHDDSCLHFTQTQKSQERLIHNYAQTPPATSTSSSPFGQPQNQTKWQVRSRRRTLTLDNLATSMDDAHDYACDAIFTDNAVADCNFQQHGHDLGACKDDDCMSMSCSSACEGSCPSQCGEDSRAICCDDDACKSAAQICEDEDCLAESRPCTDENCLVEPAMPPQSQQQPTSAHLSDGDKAAAAALASFGDNQSQIFHNAYLQRQQQQQQLSPPPGTPGDGTMSLMDFPISLPCGSLSMESLLTSSNGALNFPNRPFQMAPEYALASHIMQYHDPAHGLAHHGSCVANDPGQFITKCTLPKYITNPLTNTDPFLPQFQSLECGFPIQDPNEFAQHIFQDHRPDLLLHAHHYDFSGQSHSAAHSHHHHGGGHGPWFNFNAVPNSRQFSPSMSPLTNLSMGPSLSATPVSLPTPSPLESDEAALADATTTTGQTLCATTESKSSLLVSQEDPYLCRWVVGHGTAICGRRFDSDEQLQKHCKHDHLRQLKKLNGGFRCGWANCARDACFTQRSKVERHLQVHTGYKPVQCTICGAALSAKQALDQHMRIHTGETPWVCKVPGCGCAFKQQSALTMHERTHTGDKPLECEICGKRFSESSNLSKHRRTHNVKGMHECQLCGKDFHRLDQLRRHMGTNHKDRPAEVNALLSQAKSKTKSHKVAKPKVAKAKLGAAKLKRERFLEADDDDDDGDGDQDGDEDGGGGGGGDGVDMIKESINAVEIQA